jgi:hypothetical protein
MNEFEQKIRQLISTFRTRLSQTWSNSAKATGQKRSESAAAFRREAAVRAQQAAAKARDLRDTDTAKKAAAKISDLRETDAAKKAEAKISDLRETDTAKKAEAKLADLRQREPVKKAEESARKALHDLFSGSKSSAGSSEG